MCINYLFLLEDIVYRLAYRYNDEIIFYFDSCGNKYVASGGNLAWRINNPGLVRSHSHFSRRNGSIGICGCYAIFSCSEEGRKALSAWLHSKKYYDSTLKTIAEYYRANAPDMFLNQLSSFSEISPDTKIKFLNEQEFDRLIIGIEKLCGYTSTGNESLSLLPKIIAKIENVKNQEDTYLIEDHIILSKAEAVEWISSYRLDGVIVHQKDGGFHLRSRPSYSMSNIRIPQEVLSPLQGPIDTLVRIVGEKKANQCLWGFINGVWNTKKSALESACLISSSADGEQVLSMPNDTLGKFQDIKVCGVLKINIDTQVVYLAVKFFRYLLSLSKDDPSHPPVVIFVHSMGAIISEHALELLNYDERQELRIYTFGGGSFIASGKCHPNSHNYASASDRVCLMGSPNDRTLAMRRYLGLKEGFTQEQLIHRWAEEDAMLYVDSIDIHVIQSFENQRRKYFEQQLANISNVTIVDAGNILEHSFCNDCYQDIVKTIILKYRLERLAFKDVSTPLMTYATV